MLPLTQIESRSLGELIDSGTIQITMGFPFGGHNGDGQGIPHIRPFNVGTDGDIHLDQIKSIPSSAAQGKPRLRYGDILFNNTNTKELVGKCATWLRQDDPVFSNHMTRIRVVDSAYPPNFLSFAILHHWMSGNSEMLARSHVAQASIIGTRFREVSVPWPAPSTQQRIERILNEVRAASLSESEKLNAAQFLRIALTNNLFKRGLRGEAHKDTEIGPIPESWKVVSFAEVREWLQYGTSVHCVLEPKDYPVLRIPNIEPARVNPTQLKYCDLASKDAEKYLLTNGDLLFIRTNGVLERLGACAVYQGMPERALFASYIIRARLKEAVVPTFAAYFFGSELGTSLIAGRATPAADGKYNLNTGTIDSLPVPLPCSVDEQNEIVAILDAMDRKIDVHRQKRAVLEELFKSLLHKLMVGEIDVEKLDLSALSGGRAEREEAAP